MTESEEHFSSSPGSAGSSTGDFRSQLGLGITTVNAITDISGFCIYHLFKLSSAKALV